MRWVGLFTGMLILGALLGALIFSGMKTRKTESETAAFVTETIHAISNGWHVHAFITRAEPGLINAMASQGQSAAELFAVYRKLGAPASEPRCHIKDTSQFGAESQYVTASYACDADYENGPATILITLRKTKDAQDWKIYYLNVASPLFSQSK